MTDSEREFTQSLADLLVVLVRGSATAVWLRGLQRVSKGETMTGTVKMHFENHRAYCP